MGDFELKINGKTRVNSNRSKGKKNRQGNNNPDVIATVYRTVTKESKLFAERMAMKDYQATFSNE